MRMFFIVVMGVLVADFLAVPIKRIARIMDRDVEKDISMTENEYTAKYIKEHPKSWYPFLPFFWLLVAVLGFLWAVFWH
jgi:hypothetical protein